MTTRLPMQLAALLWVCGTTAHAAVINLKLDPDLRFTQEENAEKQQQSLMATLPLVPGRDEGCVVEFDFTLVRAWYYAPLHIGVRSSDGRNAIVLLFEKVGGEASQCTVFVREDGRERAIATWDNVDGVKYRLVLKWRKDGRFRVLARKGDSEVFRASGQVRSPWILDEFSLVVINNNENGYIGYDCEDECIVMRSQPSCGSYVIAAAIDFLSMNALARENDQ